jgi:hypothetical protein
MLQNLSESCFSNDVQVCIGFYHVFIPVPWILRFIQENKHLYSTLQHKYSRIFELGMATTDFPFLSMQQQAFCCAAVSALKKGHNQYTVVIRRTNIR